MTLHIFDTDFVRRGIISSYLSIQWSEDYYDRGDFTLICVDSAENIALLKQGYYVYRSDKQTAMIIRHIKYISADNQIIVKGYTTLDLIKERIIYKTQSVYNVESGMISLINQNTQGNRIIERFTTAPIKGFTEIFDTQFTGTNLLEALTQLGTESEIGFYMLFDHKNKQHVFTPYKGVNRIAGQREIRPIIFSADLRNLNNVTITDDISFYRNVAYVAGGGENEERRWVIVNDQEFSGMDRFELYVDARDLQQTTYEDGEEIIYSDAEYVQILTARGIKKLNEYLKIETFVAEVNPIGFGSDYYLGDVVSCKSDKYGVRFNTRILAYSEQSEGGLYKLSLTMGNPELTTYEVVKTWLT